jgi:type I restriction enzyme S subunit
MKIAEILSTWDDAIQQTRKLIDAKKRLKKGLMQQLLTGKKRLPVYEKQNNRVPYRFFDLPEDWECPQIKDIAIECSERNRNGDDLPVLACSKYTGFVQSSEYFGKRVFSENTTNYKIIRRGQFGFPSNHIEEGSIGLLRKPDKGLVSPIYTVFQCNEKVIPEYLYAVLKTDTFRHIFKTATNASVDRRGSLRWKEFSLIHVPLPARREQKAIADALATLDEDISLHEKKLNALEKQKRGLMQKLLTGEIRVIV